MALNCRAATSADITRIAYLFDQYRQFYEQAPSLKTAQEFIGQRFAKNESVLLVAETAESEIVGFCQMYPSFCSVEAAPIYLLYDLFVEPTSRKTGAGSLLLQAAEAKAAADGKVRMDLTTAKNNLPAQSLYESHGWVRDEVFYAYNLHVTHL